MPLTISPPLTNVALVEVLNALVKQAPQAFRYTIKDYGVVFSPPATNPPQFFTREFKVDTNTFLNGLRSLGSPIDFNPTNSSAGKVSMAARNVFTNVGVNLDSPPGKTVYYNERSGKLLVRATEPDLDFIEKIIYKLNYEPPQIHIKARFMEVPESFFGDATETFFSTALPHSFPAGVTNGIGILTATEAKQFLKELKLQKGFESLGEPEVTSSSGRQCQMRSTSVRTIVTNAIFSESPTNRSAMTFQTAKIETGPVLDAVPQVLADGYTVSISTVAGVTKFFGYADSTDSTNLVPDMFTNATGEIGALPVNLPAVQLSRATAHKNLWDGQTLVLFPKAEQVLFSKPDKERDARVAEHIRQAEKKSGKKKLVVLVTVEIVDPAGNRVHTEEDLPFAQDKIPVQPGAK